MVTWNPLTFLFGVPAPAPGAVQSFSGFFSYKECYKALKFTNNDICEAASWLVEEGEKERGKKSLVKKRSILIGESEILSEN